MKKESRLQNRASGARASNLELYRIITMLLIVMHHYVVNSGVLAEGSPIYADPSSPKLAFMLLFGAWGKTGINCFLLITGYFMCKRDITVKKFAKLFIETMLYRLIFAVIFWSGGYETFSAVELLKTLIPIKSVTTDFFQTYLIFFLLIPFINAAVRNVSERMHLRLLLVLGVTYILMGTVGEFSVTMNYVSWFTVVYLIGAYMGRYPKQMHDKTLLWLALTVCSFGLSVFSVIYRMHHGGGVYMYVSDSNTLLAVTNAVCSFLLFKNLKIPYVRAINEVASATYGVLLIHAASNAMRQWLWRDTVKVAGSSALPFGKMALHAVMSVLIIYAVCTVIELMRLHFLEKPFFALWDKKAPALYERFTRLEDRLCRKLNIGD